MGRAGAGTRVPSIIVHGGAGADPAEDRDELREGMRAATLAGWHVLAAGGSALDAVERAVCALEDHPRFNAGRGAVLTSAGTVELDASIMEGDRLGCGAVGAVSTIAHPITLARRILDDGRHVLLVGEGAHQFARALRLPECGPASLLTERQRRRHALRGQRGGGSARRGRARARRAGAAGLARAHGLDSLHALHARGVDVAGARRARSPVLNLISAADIDAARRRLAGAISETPCAYSQTLSEITGSRCFVKLENLQMTGSFKERGAPNLLLQLDEAERGRGALAGGIGVAVKARRPDVRVMGVQAEGLAAMRRSLEAGRRLTLAPAPTIADGIAVRQVGETTFELARRYVDEIVAVSEEELANAILLLLEIEKTVVEGAGAAPLAALVNRKLGLAGARVVLVLSGGNIDVTMLSRIIERGLVKDGRLVRLGVLLRDRPGELARLTALIAAERANILHLEHDRAFSQAAIAHTEAALP